MLSIASHRRGWDLDAVATPMVTALGDMTTLPSLFIATYLVRNDAVATASAIIAIAVALYAAVRAYTVADAAVRRIVLEMTATILAYPDPRHPRRGGAAGARGPASTRCRSCSP